MRVRLSHVPRLDCRLRHDLSEGGGAIDRVQAAKDADVRKVGRRAACKRLAAHSLVDPACERSVDGGTLVLDAILLF